MKVFIRVVQAIGSVIAAVFVFLSYYCVNNESVVDNPLFISVWEYLKLPALEGHWRGIVAFALGIVCIVIAGLIALLFGLSITRQDDD